LASEVMKLCEDLFEFLVATSYQQSLDYIQPVEQLVVIFELYAGCVEFWH
jgi:hypothetical protein